MHKVAVIGPLGSGKSEIVRICSELDYPVISADHVARMLLELPGVAHDDVVKAFPSVADPVGRIDRKLLAKDVFSNYSHLKQLEDIIHPHVWQIVASFFMECEKKNEDVCFVEVSAPDQTISTRFDEMWCAKASYELRKDRCVSKGMTEEDFRARDAFQTEHCDYEALATRVIENENDVEVLEEKIKSYLNDLIENRKNGV